MFRLIDRYIIFEIFPYFLLSLFLLTSIIFVQQANRFSELFIIFSQHGVSSIPLLLLVLSLLPGILIFTLPISFLLSVLLGLGRLSGDSEILVMRTNGISPLQLLRPITFIGIFVMILTAYNTFYLLPISVNSLNNLKKTKTQVVIHSIEMQVKPGEFVENLPSKVLYVEQNNRTTRIWNNIFIVEQDDNKETNNEPKIYTAKAGYLVFGNSIEDTELRLQKSYIYESESRKFGKQKDYPVSYSSNAVIRFDLGEKSSQQSNSDYLNNTVASSNPDLMTLPQLLSAHPEPNEERHFSIEIHKRFALPIACLFFALIGVALGITLPRSGRSSGLLIGLLITIAYYLILLSGEKAARQGVLPSIIGIWGPDILLGICSYLLFTKKTLIRNNSFVVTVFWKNLRYLMRYSRNLINRIVNFGDKNFNYSQPKLTKYFSLLSFGSHRIIDRLVFSEALHYGAFVLVALYSIFVTFTLFDLINHIVKNNVKISLIIEYLIFLTPQIINYLLPFAILVSVLVTFGIFGKTSQIVALNSSGQSLYRLILPILAIATLASTFMFVSGEYILPVTNRSQDYLRYLIKGGQLPPQTFYQSNRKWFRGQDNRIFNFRHFNKEKNEFFGFSIYEINPDTAGLKSRIYVKQAKWNVNTSEWILTKGWKHLFSSDGRTLDKTEIIQEQLKIPEDPNYFKQEVAEFDKMSIRQLHTYINELHKNGIDTLDLHIALQSKFATPLACFVMALVGLPFSFSMGKKGALVGISIGVIIAILFWGTISVFDQMGRYELLPSIWAVWGPNLLFSAGGLYLLFNVRT